MNNGDKIKNPMPDLATTKESDGIKISIRKIEESEKRKKSKKEKE